MSNDINVGAISEALNDKADRDINNLTTGGYAKGSGLGMPSSRYTDLTLGADGAEYTAPANGWFALSCIVGNTQNAYVTIISNIEVLSHNNYVGASVATCVPVVKGQTVVVGYSWVQSVNYFRFVYAEGEQ